MSSHKILRLLSRAVCATGLLAVFVCVNMSSGRAQSTRFVQDHANVLSEESKAYLVKLLSHFEAATTNELIVATYHTYGDADIQTFARDLASDLKLGYKDMANGVAVIIFEKEHKAWIEVGAGLSKKIPYGYQQSLVKDVMAPAFRRYDYDSGVIDVIHALMRHIDPGFRIHRREAGRPWLAQLTVMISAVVLLIIGLIDLFGYSNYRRSAGPGPSHTYRERVGVYSLLEWWLLYGTIPNILEYAVSSLISNPLNSSWSISASGSRRVYLHLKTGGGRFRGNGVSGRW